MIELIEIGGGFDVRCAEAEVAFVTITVQFEIGIRERDGKYFTVTLSTPFKVRQDTAGEWIALDPEADDERLGVLAVRLRYASVTGCHISPDGTLSIEFGPQFAISVEPDAQYESWEVEQERFKVVGGAGGELFVWRRDK
jgi:Family of unknown function (DUF6188)